MIMTDININTKTVCFTGHRLISSAEYPVIRDSLEANIRRLYSSGSRDFLCGGALGFDTLAARTIIGLKKELTGIRLIMIIPCQEQSIRWKQSERDLYQEILDKADQVEILSPFYYEGCMLNRNRYLVDHSEICVCYLKHMRGGTVYTVSYAVKKGLEVINLALNTEKEVLCEPTCNSTYISRSVSGNADTVISCPIRITRNTKKFTLMRFSGNLVFKRNT